MVDTNEIREHGGWLRESEARELCDEIDRLRAQLAAQCHVMDTTGTTYGVIAADALARAEAAEQGREAQEIENGVLRDEIDRLRAELVDEETAHGVTIRRAAQAVEAAWQALGEMGSDAYLDVKARAEHAEHLLADLLAYRNNWQARAERAEAAIASAEALCDEVLDDTDDCHPFVDVRCVRVALRGGQ